MITCPAVGIVGFFIFKWVSQGFARFFRVFAAEGFGGLEFREVCSDHGHVLLV